VGRPCRSVARGLVLAALVLPLLVLSLAGCSSKGPIGANVGSASATVSPGPVGGKDVKTIYFAGGCFWGIEKYLDQIHGVTATEVGYANGASNSATYGDGSGYAEAVRVDYDPSVAPLPFLLREFYLAIDPTSVDRQGNDVGKEYRSGIYYTDPADLPIIEASLARLQTQHSAPIAIETGPLKTYTRAEDYHQKYLQKNPEGYCHIPLNLFKQAASARPDPSELPAAK
jgi:peptide methionine sulfoxide reductase msrA/msrB